MKTDVVTTSWLQICGGSAAGAPGIMHQVICDAREAPLQAPLQAAALPPAAVLAPPSHPRLLQLHLHAPPAPAPPAAMVPHAGLQLLVAPRFCPDFSAGIVPGHVIPSVRFSLHDQISTSFNARSSFQMG